MRAIPLAAAFALIAAACSSSPPPRWAEGGAPLDIGFARWIQDDNSYLEVRPDGQIVDEDGDEVMLVDRAGRVVDEDHEPIAILLPSGQVAGPDDRALGHVGVTNASPPGSTTAWLAIMPDGEVIRFDSDGERDSGGRWQGCQGPRMRMCTLVTHVVAVREYVEQRGRVGVGVGVGIGVGY